MLNRSVFIVLAASLSIAGQQAPRQPDTQVNVNVTTKNRQARALLNEAKASALRGIEPFDRGLVLDEIGAAQAKAGDLDAAVDTAIQAYPNTLSTLRAIGERLGDSNDLDTAQAIRPKLKGGGSSTLFAFFSKQQANKGNIDEALRTTDLIDALEVRNDALGWIGERQVANGDYVGARKTFALAKAIDPTRSSFPGDLEMTLLEQIDRGDAQGLRTTVNLFESSEERAGAMLSIAESRWQKGDKAGATAWLEEALQQLTPGLTNDLTRYFAIPMRVRFGQKEQAMQSAGAFSTELRSKGYMAVAVTCAEAKDIPCVDAAIGKMRSTHDEDQEGKISDLMLKSMILNVTAALIDTGEFEAASRLLIIAERRNKVGSWKRAVEPVAQLQRVFMLAKRSEFREARRLALKIRPDSIPQEQRGNALRAIALLQTKRLVFASSQSWVSRLTHPVDRTYALLGIAQALLEIGEVKLPYSAITVH